MNAALLGPALGAAAAIYFLVRSLRILKTGTATLAGIPLKGWLARFAAVPMLIGSLAGVTGGLWMTTMFVLDARKAAGGAALGKPAAAASHPGLLDGFKGSLASLTGRFSPPAREKKPAAGPVEFTPVTARDLSEAEFRSVTSTPDKLAVVLFHREGDGPSRMVQRELEGVALEFSGRVEIARVDVERFPKLAKQEDIRGVPDIRYFRNGKRVDQVTGPAPASMLRMRFQQLAPAPPVPDPEPAVVAVEPVERLPSGSGSISRMKKGWVPPGMQRW
ncbi:thioredoxin family protein [Luteolibacter ambystomatis]|uniref:Thioredoxin family protein n=1 Tax=Luteolibacter ambystomatis TaxID=2824561 RepID=A0A975G7A7_9BACT|nr:thioredoxin family protein [Luteolibacter ambystomatis]QUE50637.1 thioredoxin family protein [Luteolibacter ambystomatis]